ncbi:hypothetical protein BOX15_Mlig007419g1 [Macrostomum lignano]|uniref:Cadherin domain-containing protein n=1 Tax=Macrostomum lignano TaxID=282301 RepID=A0A267F9W9_9PLAT|nr:hypothetical protein BOX15_Mlig007419g1 [Macrostomum lignano]
MPPASLHHQILIWLLLATARSVQTDPFRLQLNVRETSDESNSRLPIDIENLSTRLTQLNRLPQWSAISYNLIVRKPPMAARSLSLDRSTGELRLVSQLRRELLCPPSISTLACSDSDPADSCQISGLVQIRDSDNPAELLILELLIDVLDIDNSPPKFDRSLSEAEIWENSPLGHAIPLPRAVDLDQGGHATCQLVYSLTPCSPGGPAYDKTFSLVRKQSSTASFVGPPEYELQLMRHLDKETVSRYRFCIAASSRLGGATATATLTVRVHDHNDNSPVWSPSQVFVVNASEANPPALLLRLSATDADSDFGLVHYRLLRDDPLFAVNSIGEVTLRRVNGLDYETASQHLLLVAAIDNGKPAFSVTATVTVNVLDANDNRPRINLDNQYKSVIENNPVPLFIHTLDVSDRDPGLNGAVTCQVGPSELRQVFYLEVKLNNRDNKIYNLYANRSFDRELISQYTVSIECSDAGTPSLSSSATVYVSIQDENDNPPAFPVSPIDISFLESVARDSQVYKLKIIDPDLDRFGSSKQREFVLTGDGAEHFRVVNQGGFPSDSGSFHYSLTTTKDFDRETRDFYRFNITVIDWIDSPSMHSNSDAPSTTVEPPKHHRATVEVSARILDVNDCSPEFNHTGPLIFEVFENASVGSAIGAVFATDRDLGENGRVLYSLAPPPQLSSLYFHSQQQRQQLQELQRLFRVDSNSGEISLRGRLDLEGPSGLSQHNLDILATDLGSPKLSSTASVVIRVLDCNDNRPKFRSAAPVAVNVTCDESVENHILPIANKELEAVDEDVSEAFKQRSYRLAGVATLSLQVVQGRQGRQQQQQQWHSFAVDKNTGQIFVKSAPKLCHFARYKLNLEVFEPSHPREVSRKSIVVTFEGGGRQPGGSRPEDRAPGGSSQRKPPSRPGDGHSIDDSGMPKGGGGFRGNLSLRSSNTEGIVIAALVVASVILAAVLILSVVLLRKRLRKDASAAAAARAAASEAAGPSAYGGTGTYMKGGRMFLMPKATTGPQLHSVQRPQQQRRDSFTDDSVTIDEEEKCSAETGVQRQFISPSSGLQTTVRLDGKAAAVGGVGGRYGNCATLGAEQPVQSRGQDSLFELADDCRMPLKGPSHYADGANSRRLQQPTYQTVLPAANQQAAAAEVQNAYMTFRYPGDGGGNSGQKMMIDSKRRPSQPSSSGEGKSSYFTVSFV